MNRFLLVPVVGTLAMAGVAFAQTPPAAGGPAVPPPPPAAAAPTGAPPPPAMPHPMPPGPGDHRMMWRDHLRQHDPLASLPKPLSAADVKAALEKRFAQTPKVKSVTVVSPQVLRVEIAMPDGRTFRYEINRTTGDRRPAW